MSRQRAFIGLGANLGDPRRSVEEALAEIAALPQTRLLRRSSLYRTAPVEAGGPDYVNAVAEVETVLAPFELLRALLAIEQAHGRRRSGRNAPRTLDLDLLLHGDTIIETLELTLPHPRLHQRAFVLEPLLEVAPGLVVDGLGELEPRRRAAAGQRIEKLPD